MIKKYLTLIIVVVALVSCGSEPVKEPATDVEVARTFVRSILDNNFDEAEKYLLNDETNRQLFDRFRKQYSEKEKAILEQYKKADIIVNDISHVTDSVCIFNYSNSYSMDSKTILKVVRPADKWLIDLKYTFSGNL